jgi:hypothetical protein
MAFDRHQRFDGCSRWTPGGEEGEIAIGDMTTDRAEYRECPIQGTPVPFLAMTFVVLGFGYWLVHRASKRDGIAGENHSRVVEHKTRLNASM